MVDGVRADLDATFDPDVRHLISVESDHHLARGDCRLASEIGFVDLGIEAQLDAVHRGLMEGLERQARDHQPPDDQARG